MIRLGIAGEAQCYHSRMITSLVNGANERLTSRSAVKDKDPTLSDMRVHAVWDWERKSAEELADQFDVPNVADSQEELAGMVDAVLILGGGRGRLSAGETPDSEGKRPSGTMVHQRYAPFFIERGVPTYIDKPLAPTVAEAEEIVALAEKTGTPVFSCSARRFSPEIQRLKDSIPEQVGELRGGFVYGNWLYEDMRFYSIHAIDALFAVLGPDVVSVRNAGSHDHHLARLDYASGLRISMAIVRNAPLPSSVILFGDKGWSGMSVGKPETFFPPFLKTFREVVGERKAPVPLRETLHAIKVLNAVADSLRDDLEIKLSMTL